MRNRLETSVKRGAKMWKLKLTCYDSVEEKPYVEDGNGSYNTRAEAWQNMLRDVIGEVESLNEPGVGCVSVTRVYGASLNGSGHEAVVWFWDMAEEGHPVHPLTGYDIVAVDDAGTEKYNEMLRQKHGEYITVVIKSAVDDDESVKFYYESARCGESDWYETVEEAYGAADDYLSNIELYVD